MTKAVITVIGKDTVCLLYTSGAYLLDPLTGSYPIEKIAGTYASKELPHYQDLFGKTVLEMA